MNLQQIKENYKHITANALPQFSSDSEEEDWERACFKFKNRKKNVLKESHITNLTSIRPNQSQILTMKQKIAQCLSTINKRDTEIGQLKQQVAKLEELNRFHEERNKELLDIIQLKNANIIEEKAAHRTIQQNFKQWEQNFESQAFDKELLERQVAYYQSQIKNLTSKLGEYSNEVKDMKKQLKIIKQLKSENEKLKEDIVRLKDLLAQSEKYKNFSKETQNKHYISQKSHEKDRWISQILICDVQNFLKQHNINSNNKQFTNSLINFINKYTESIVKKIQLKAKKTCQSRIKEMKRLHNYSFFVTDFKKSHYNSHQKKNKNQEKSRHLRTMLECSVNSNLDSSSGPVKTISKKQFCIKILNQLRSKISIWVDEKEFQLDKINIMIDWAIQSISAHLTKEKDHTRVMSISKISKAVTHLL